ncbi:hypothetical protein AYI70_g156 [Smittium culicis]|uniref:Conserved oligomeric Golgi complex subunit 7 n=1 Tax=Smittium culicis TaxID=133412 RepID=A0A1R1YIB1_9FUNG|nr:hypothetical protein AYI70_g156 [Smittium culicis]
MVKIDIHDFDDNIFDPVKWLNSVLESESPNFDLKSTSDDIQINYLDSKIKDLVNNLSYHATEANSNKDKERLKLERTLMFLNRDIETFRGNLKSSKNELDKISLALPISDYRISYNLNKTAKFQLIRSRFSQIQVAIDKTQKLLALPNEILKLKELGQVVDASAKLKEAKSLVNNLTLLNESGHIPSKIISINGNNALESKDYENFQSYSIKDSHNTDSKSFLVKILNRFDDLENELSLEGTRILKKSISERDFDSCKIWINFFINSDSIKTAEDIYISQKELELIELWDNIYNPQSLTSASADSLSYFTEFKNSLITFLGKLVEFYDLEIEFCEMIEIQNSKDLVIRPFTQTFEKIGTYISAHIKSLNIDESFEPKNFDSIIELYKIIREFVNSMFIHISNSASLEGIGVSKSLEKNSLQKNSVLNKIFGYLISPFIPIQSNFCKYEKIILDNELSPIIEKTFKLPNNYSGITETKSKNNVKQIKSLSNDMILADFRAISSTFDEIRNLFFRKLFLIIEQSTKKFFFFTCGIVAVEYIKIIEECFLSVETAFKAFFSTISERARIPSSKLVSLWVQASSTYENNLDSKKKIHNVIDYDFAPTGSALWWAQAEFILVSFGLFNTFIDSLRIYSYEFSNTFLSTAGSIYNKFLDINDQPSESLEPEFHLTQLLSTPLNSSILYEFYEILHNRLKSQPKNDHSDTADIPENTILNENGHHVSDILHSKESSTGGFEMLSDLSSLVLPKSISIAVREIYPNLQLSLFGLLFWSQLGTIEKIPSLEQWHLKSSSPSVTFDYPGKSGKNKSGEPDKSTNNFKVPVFSLSPSLNIRTVGEQIMHLPMILEQIESKKTKNLFNGKEIDLSDTYLSNCKYCGADSETSSFICSHIMDTGKSVLSFPILFVDNIKDRPLDFILELIEKRKSELHATSGEWFFVLANSIMDQFVIHANMVKKPLSENGKSQLATDINYLNSIFSTMDIPINDTFASLQNTYIEK